MWGGWCSGVRGWAEEAAIAMTHGQSIHLWSHAGKSATTNKDVHELDLVLCRSAARPSLTLDVLHSQSHNLLCLPRTLEPCTRHSRRSIWSLRRNFPIT